VLALLLVPELEGGGTAFCRVFWGEGCGWVCSKHCVTGMHVGVCRGCLYAWTSMALAGSTSSFKPIQQPVTHFPALVSFPLCDPPPSRLVTS
jgi:hypothetical protein